MAAVAVLVVVVVAAAVSVVVVAVVVQAALNDGKINSSGHHIKLRLFITNTKM